MLHLQNQGLFFFFPSDLLFHDRRFFHDRSHDRAPASSNLWLLFLVNYVDTYYLSCFSASKTAYTFPALLLVPKIFEVMFLIPATSTTLLTAPPAIIPVPAGAGFNNIKEAPSFIKTLWAIVPLTILISIKCFFARDTAFIIADDTSSDFARPTPTLPALFPTTTSAENLTLFPPVVFLEIRFICTTFSSNFSPVYEFSIIIKNLVLPFLQPPQKP